MIVEEHKTEKKESNQGVNNFKCQLNTIIVHHYEKICSNKCGEKG